MWKPNSLSGRVALSVSLGALFSGTVVALVTVVLSGRLSHAREDADLHGGARMLAYALLVKHYDPVHAASDQTQEHAVSKSDGQRYEIAFEREHHQHLVCTRCGQIVEYQSAALVALQREIAERYGFELDNHVVERRGRCEARQRRPRALAKAAPAIG